MSYCPLKPGDFFVKHWLCDDNEIKISPYIFLGSIQMPKKNIHTYAPHLTDGYLLWDCEQEKTLSVWSTWLNNFVYVWSRMNDSLED